ncbi:MAG TPA: cation diffusion facilitator family transporter [Baekduia sp.]|uniref:cation diffusion facilitator family transporter n=1 Tax=Baekduia sp. TaxID=2600305 RepID=UPI002D783998|nr:cation diffusion facilitator family transporter [Baekduia sp.]HET6506420.1 cation diffusion facilitator family transporter [Baekduia sp.]
MTGDAGSGPETARDASFTSVLAALAANTAIAIAKGIAAALTGSAALFAETLHTVADAGNEIFLFMAISRSERPPDESHPLGYGPERWYWALLAAIGMFVVGGAVSIWEGINALFHPRALEAFWVGVSILVIAIVLDGTSRAIAVHELRGRAARAGMPLRQFIAESSDPTVTTVYLEDTIDVLGATLALTALILHKVTGIEIFDPIATIVIGGLLTYVAIRLTGRNRALLTNQSVAPRHLDALREAIEGQPGIVAVRSLEAVSLGPRSAMVAAEVQLREGLTGDDVATTLQVARDTLCTTTPAIARLYLTPVTVGADPSRPPRTPPSP